MRGTKKAVFAYALTACVAMLPVCCGYIMNSGVIGEWIARIHELSQNIDEGRLLLFPSWEMIAGNGAQVYAMNSDLWFWIPALVSGWTGNVVRGWQFYMCFVQVGTLLTSLLFFGKIFEGEESGWPRFFGVLFYMTCPYRIYICYDLANMSQAAVWMLLPLFLWAIVSITAKGHNLKNILIAGLVLAGIGYADMPLMVVISGVTALAGICLRRWRFFLSLALGWGLAFPAVLRLVRYLFSGAYDMWNFPLDSIMGRGYVPGDFFGYYVYPEGYPGIGIGLMTGLLAGIWLIFVKGRWEKKRECAFFAVLSVIFLIFSLKVFPWEYVQRVGVWALKFVPLMHTPAIFFGMAQLCLCVPGAWSVGQAGKQEEKTVAVGVPLLILLSSIAVCVYQCNMLTYTRLPI